MSIHSASQRLSTWLDSFTMSIIRAVEDPEFNLFENNQEQIQYILTQLSKNEKTKRILSPESTGKNSRTSMTFREQGNLFFTSKQGFSLDKAVEEYTKSVAYASPGSRELSLAYANRSAALFEAKLFHDCVMDIERAIDNNYPDNLKAKIYMRKAMCYQVMDYDEFVIEDSLAEARIWLDKMDEKNKKNTAKLLEKRIKAEPTDGLKFRKNHFGEASPKLTKKNSLVPGLSAAVELKYSEKYGRHVVATRDIKPGEILVKQKTYAKVVSLELRYKVCWNCAKQTWTGLPCKSCSDVIYCSEFCLMEDENKQHKFECGIIGPMIEFEMDNMFFMSLRLTIKALMEAEGSIEILKNGLGAINVVQDLLIKGPANNALDPTKYVSIYSLSTNSEGKIAFKSTFLAKSIIIAYLLATKTQFFGERMCGDLRDFQDNRNFIFIVSLIEKNLHLSITNSFEMNILFKKDKIKIFNAVSTPISFFNHSCNPMITKRLHDNFVASYALYPIKKGEQIFDSYGMYYYQSNKQERQSSLLEQYNFICDCESCKKDWPLNPMDSESLKDDGYEAHASKLSQIANKLMTVVISLEDTNRFSHAPISISNAVEQLAELIEQLCSHQERNSMQVFQSIRLLDGFLCVTETRFHLLD